MEFFLAITLILAPAYTIRFNFFHLPTNLLMLWIFSFWIIFGVWLIKNKRVENFVRFKISMDKKIIIPLSLFFLAGLISLFIGGINQAKLGQFIVLFLQPIFTFFIAAYITRQFPRTKFIIHYSLYIILATAGAYAIVQYFTLYGLPPDWWGNSVEPKRAIAFFSHPNFYALWSAPLLAFLIPDIFSSLSLPLMGRVREGWQSWIKILAWALGAAGLLLSLSRAGWLGLAAAVLVYLIVAADGKIRKIIFAAVVVMAMVIISVPNLRWRFILPFYGETSANSRIELWQSGWRAVKTSPIFGLGLNGYANNYQTFQTDKTLDIHNYPHNIFLDLWVETGLIGLISMVGLIAILIFRGLKKSPLPNSWGGAGGEVKNL